MMTPEQAVALIKSHASELGFVACGIASAQRVAPEAEAEYRRWLHAGHAADMNYMQAHEELRYDPRLLHPGCRSLIVVALNYFPRCSQEGDLRFASYAYGADYHYVVKQRLTLLSDFIAAEVAPALMPGETYDARPFCDSAPMMEHYWAVQAGVGFMGRNRLLIVPHYGSYCFLGVLAVNLDLPADSPLTISCGTCRRCLDACPTGALHEEREFSSTGSMVDARRCISYHTIESRAEEIDVEIAAQMGNRVYGCDACQECCPWNRFARPTEVVEFHPSEAFLSLNADALCRMTGGDFKRMFKHSAIMRAGYKGLLRNLKAVEQCRGDVEK